jgi:hypothetical protein
MQGFGSYSMNREVGMKQSIFTSILVVLTICMLSAIPALADTITLRPVGTGDMPYGSGLQGMLAYPNGSVSSNLNGGYPDTTNPFSDSGSGANWTKVDDVVADGNATYVYSGGNDHGDLYTLADSGLAAGTTVNKVTLYAVMRAASSKKNGYFGIKSGDEEHWGIRVGTALIPLPTTYTLFSRDYAENPDTDSKWTVSSIDSLQVGFFADNNSDSGFYATQIYVVVDYTQGSSAAAPEPATMLLLGSGLIGLAGYARRRFKK